MRLLALFLAVGAFLAPASVLEAKADVDVPGWSHWLGQTLPGGWAPPDNFVFHPPTDLSNWRFGGYVGQFTLQRLSVLEFTPWLLNMRDFKPPAFIETVDVHYKAVELPFVPLTVGADFNVSRHFGGENYSEFAFAPTLTWDWFPWNNYVYTRYRVGPIGISYDTSKSALEATQTFGRRTTKLLNYAMAELILAPSKDSKWEVFGGVHHRCGVYGLISHVNGGESYTYVGFRAGF
jgi:hypothetical protein